MYKYGGYFLQLWVGANLDKVLGKTETIGDTCLWIMYEILQSSQLPSQMPPDLASGLA